MHLDAFNLGGPECHFTADDLRQLQLETAVPFISANVTDGLGQSIAPSWKDLSVGGQTIAVVGVVDPDLVPKPLVGADPYRSIYDLLPEIQADRIIVLAYMDEPKLRELAKKLPDVDSIIGGPTGQVVSPTRVGHVLVSSSTNKGKFILKLEVSPHKPIDAEVVEVDSEIEMAERQQANLRDFYATLGERDFSPSQTQFVSRRIIGESEQRIAGNESCIACHQADDAVWHQSKHSHAWTSLQATGAQVDPACQRCHTTGYGSQGGFMTAKSSESLVDVGCENCHGPSSQHVADPRNRTPFVASQQCVICHDHENSPQFQYDTYWAKIAHGKKEAKP
jgi:2',3'-cyclic-nucleotide 2'-phosphodiesterase (5'-nucleotidase family)